MKRESCFAVQQNDDPSEAEVSEVQARLITAITELYYQHRHLIGWENRPLTIV